MLRLTSAMHSVNCYGLILGFTALIGHCIAHTTFEISNPGAYKDLVADFWLVKEDLPVHLSDLSNGARFLFSLNPQYRVPQTYQDDPPQQSYRIVATAFARTAYNDYKYEPYTGSMPEILVNGTSYTFGNRTLMFDYKKTSARYNTPFISTVTYDCGKGNYFTQADADLWSNLYTGDATFSKDPCRIISDPEAASSDLNARDDPVADGSYTNATYASLADVPTPGGSTVTRRSGSNSAENNVAGLKALTTNAPIICRDVHASSRTIYVYGTIPADSIVNGKLGLHLNICFQNGKVIVDKDKVLPFIEARPFVDKDRALLGFQWKFDATTTGGLPRGVTAGCENNCEQYRVTYQGQLIQKIKAGGGLDGSVVGIGLRAQGSVDVDRPGEDASITIVVRATDGATFCAPSQLGFTGTGSCLHPDDN